ncbi:MAG: class I SAM-dependent methyltransferase [Patescibacteria group bacterium]
MDYLKLATDPAQYDSPEVNWSEVGREDSPSRQYFQSHLQSIITSLKDKKVLDIGCGIGQLFKLLKEMGASEIYGFDPSQKNIDFVQSNYKGVNVQKNTLQNYVSPVSVDVCIAVMVFEHIFDLQEAFNKINSFLNLKGLFYLIIGDKSYNIGPRADLLSIDIMEIRDGVVTTKTVRESWTSYDIFRPLQNTISAAESAGFLLEEQKELPERIPMDPSHPKTCCHLLVLRKVK